MKPLAVLLAWTCVASLSALPSRADIKLPQATTFKGKERFERITRQAVAEKWAALPMGQRVAKFGRALEDIPYKGFTLEIHDHIESPSVNFYGLDCWTFFETCLGMARMIETPKRSYAPDDLLKEIELTRYRAGVCNGNYLDRIHYLAEWYFENEARGTVQDITRELGGAKRVYGRECREMTLLWKSYRYLKKNPSLRPGMKQHELRCSKLPVYYIPTAHVDSIQHKIKDGDVLGIVTKHQGGFCSHVGLAVTGKDGRMRILHASSTHKKVINEATISGYLRKYSKHIGIIVGRPLPVKKTVTDSAVYQKNLSRLTGAR